MTQNENPRGVRGGRHVYQSQRIALRGSTENDVPADERAVEHARKRCDAGLDEID